MNNIIKKRKIQYLVHFTNVENLQSIFSNGLVPRIDIDNNLVSGKINDEKRFDNLREAVCTSVSFPNYQMFYSHRCRNEENKWCVLVLKTQILIDFECVFCYSNAGSRDIFTIPIEKRKGTQAFEGIFRDRLNYPSREMTQIPDCYPTNPQAEVLVVDKIPPQYIYAIAFEEENIMNKYKHIIPSSVKCKVYHKFFNYREDWAYWKK